jgi:hypothetical protein
MARYFLPKKKSRSLWVAAAVDNHSFPIFSIYSILIQE